MAQKKAGEVDAFLSRPDTSFPVVLLYGPDAGLVAERAGVVATLSGVDAADPFSAATLSADEVEKDAGPALRRSAYGVAVRRAAPRARSRRRRGVGPEPCRSDRRARRPPAGGRDDRRRGRRHEEERPGAPRHEKARAAMALPCYPDEGRALDAMIDAELKAAGLSIGREARETLRERLGADRLASRGEVQKLCLYCRGQTAIAVADIDAIVGDVSVDTVEEAIDAAATGEVRKLPELIERLSAAGTQGFLLQQGLLRHFQALQLMRQSVEKGGQSIPRVVEGRHPHFRRKAALETALGLWPLAGITAVLGRIEADILDSRKEAALAATLVHASLLSVAVEAARLRARR